MTATKIVTPKAAAKDIEKDASMAKQKQMMAAHYDRLTAAPQTGAKVCCTFVPGNLNELIMCFDLLNNRRRLMPSRAGCAACPAITCSKPRRSAIPRTCAPM